MELKVESKSDLSETSNENTNNLDYSQKSIENNDAKA